MCQPTLLLHWPVVLHRPFVAGPGRLRARAELPRIAVRCAQCSAQSVFGAHLTVSTSMFRAKRGAAHPERVQGDLWLGAGRQVGQ